MPGYTDIEGTWSDSDYDAAFFEGYAAWFANMLSDIRREAALWIESGFDVPIAQELVSIDSDYDFVCLSVSDSDERDEPVQFLTRYHYEFAYHDEYWRGASSGIKFTWKVL